jgi:hypothetical protein
VVIAAVGIDDGVVVFGEVGAVVPGGGSSTSAITNWVKAHYRAKTIGGQTVYDLTQPLQS